MDDWFRWDIDGEFLVLFRLVRFMLFWFRWSFCLKGNNVKGLDSKGNVVNRCLDFNL